MELKLVNGSGALQVSEAAFGHKFNEALVHQVMTAYRNAGRAGLDTSTCCDHISWFTSTAHQGGPPVSARANRMPLASTNRVGAVW